MNKLINICKHLCVFAFYFSILCFVLQLRTRKGQRLATFFNQYTYTILLYYIQGGTQVSKLDKADILEMTVSHLRQIHHQQLSAAMASSSSVITQYREGYTECATETIRYMEASRAYPADMVMRMRHNLANKVGYTRDYPAHVRYGTCISAAPNDLSTVTKTRECTPVKVKVESLSSPTKSVSPDSGFDSAFSPLLMLVPGAKLEKDSRTNKNCSMNSSSDSSMYYSTTSGNTSMDTSTEQCSTSDTSVEHTSAQACDTSSGQACDTSSGKATSGLPPRSPARDGGSPQPKTVWRPF